MNAETGTEPEAPKKRGRIPQAAWPQILERYRSGATLSAIAREFECTPSAISYIIRKAEAADAPGEDDAGTVPAEAPAAPEAAAPVESPAPAPKASRRAPAEPKGDTPKADAKAAESPAEERRPTLTVTPPAPAAAAPTETLRLNRPDPQPAPQPAPVPAASAPAAPATQTAAPASAPPAAAGGRAEPTPPVDAVEARLRETARGCLAAYRGWRQQPGETSIQALSDAVHELRKALARIEIDMSASRREEQAIRPIPIPAHRAARRTP